MLKALGALVAALKLPSMAELQTTLNEAAQPPLDPPFDRLLKQLAVLVKAVPAQELEADFVRLFFSPRGALCPPWEGVWNDPEGHLFGPAHEAVLALSRQAGVEPVAFQNESCDHVAMELALVGLLLERGDGGGEILASFWQKHVASWMPAFARDMQEKAQTDFYRTVGRLLETLTSSPPSCLVS
ncbi:MAG: TorD/DmsD family molecular chaperone [Thermoanaerobaculum sp.]